MVTLWLALLGGGALFALIPLTIAHLLGRLACMNGEHVLTWEGRCDRFGCDWEVPR